MGLYLDNGYLDFGWIYSRPYHWQLVTGGRGTGKTYGALKFVKENKIKFIYLRRTQAQADIISRDEFSPFKVLNRDMGWNVGCEPVTKYNAAYFDMEADDNGKFHPTGPPIGYTAALSTFSNIRGFDASDVDCIIYDEFIPEKHERSIKHEFEALANAYETVARNRELAGRTPLKLIGLSNSNDISNDIFAGLDLISRAVKMSERGQEIYEDPRRGIALYLLGASPISAAKQDTALYRAAAGSAFSDMALGNQFTDDVTSTVIRSRDKNQLRLIATIGELSIYEIKGGGYYAGVHRFGAGEQYCFSEMDKERFRRKYYWFWLAYVDRQVECENYLAETILQKVFKC